MYVLWYSAFRPRHSGEQTSESVLAESRAARVSESVLERQRCVACQHKPLEEKPAGKLSSTSECAVRDCRVVSKISSAKNGATFDVKRNRTSLQLAGCLFTKTKQETTPNRDDVSRSKQAVRQNFFFLWSVAVRSCDFVWLWYLFIETDASLC